MEIKIFMFLNGEELLNCDKDIDVLFLDIQMNQLDGIEIAKRMRNKNHYKGFLIFITVLKEMVFQSFEVQPFDYLLKPVEYDNFKSTMERLMLSLKNSDKKLFIQRRNESSIISFGEIIFCEIIDRKVYLHLKSADVIDYYDKIENLETKLDNRFFRCHRSYLINMQYLISYKNGTAYMAENHQIPVSRLRSKDFSNVILQYMKEWRL